MTPNEAVLQNDSPEAFLPSNRTPNRLCMACAVLRHNGVDVGRRDHLGEMLMSDTGR
jgi:hypothetical protein